MQSASVLPAAPSNVDRWTQRAFTELEGFLNSGATGARLGRDAIDISRLHDARHDLCLDEALKRVRRALRPETTDDDRRALLWQIGRLIQEAQRADAAEDA